jgi:hypothetical protein
MTLLRRSMRWLRPLLLVVVSLVAGWIVIGLIALAWWRWRTRGEHE